jgi:zinc transport system substrate-binding protein
MTPRFKILTSVTLLTWLVFSSALWGCATNNPEKLGVVTSTSLIAQIVERVGGDRVSVVNIIPPAQCPGHFDVKPGDIQKLAAADLFLFHGWQGEKFSQEIIASADNFDLTTVQLDIQTTENQNWMVPTVQMEAVDIITSALCQVDSENNAVYQQSATEYTDKILAKEMEIKARLNQVNLAEVSVLCAEQQAGFVSWLGLNVIATYGRPDSLTPQVVRELVDTGRDSGVTLIIDNLQSGQEAGASIAEELGVTKIILSNFPGSFPDTETWEKAIDKNVQLILEATGQ